MAKQTKDYPAGTYNPILRKAIEQCDNSCLYVQDGVATLALTKKVKQAGPFDERVARYEFPVSIRAGYADMVDESRDEYGPHVSYSHKAENRYEPARGCVHSPHYRLRELLPLLPYGAELSFYVWLDASSNGYAAIHRVHTDYVYLHVKHGDKTSKILIDTSLCEHNSARFGGSLGATQRQARTVAEVA